MSNSRSLVNSATNQDCHSERSEESLSHRQSLRPKGCFRFPPFSVSRTRGVPGIVAASLLLVSLAACNVNVKEKKDGNGDKEVTIQSPIANMQVGEDVTGEDTGISLYPGAKLAEKSDDGGSDRANFNLSTSIFGIKLVVVKYTSDDAPDKLVSFYTKDLKKFGSVLECQKSGKGPDVNLHIDSGDKSKGSNEQKCRGDGKGDTIELKVGPESNQHIVAVSPKGKGSEFALVYVRTRDDKTI